MDKKRLLSIDTLRGMEMLVIMGLSTLIFRICDLFPGGGDSWMAAQMRHVDWNGLAIMDMVFPVFLFIAGLSYPFSYASQVEKGRTSWQIHRKIFVRCLLLIALGIVYNGFFNLDFPQRYASVLGRIGLAWMFAALLYVHCKPKARIVIAILLPGKPYYGNFDPEGLLGVIPATVTAMLGMFTGEFVRLPEEKCSGGKKTLLMLGAAVVLIAAGLLWSLSLPLNKKLWTSTFVLVVGGISVALYAVVYYIVEVKGHVKWTFPFRVIGLNSITIYLLQRIVPLREVTDFFLGGTAGLLPEAWGAALLAVGYILVCWLLLYFLYRHKVFLKV